MEIDESANDLRDGRIANRIVRDLRLLRDESEILTHVRRLIAIEPKVGNRIARRTLRKASSFEELLIEGLDRGNASTIDIWLDSASRTIGPDRLLHILLKAVPEHRRGVEDAMYWLPQYVKSVAGHEGKIAETQKKLADRLE